MKEDLSILSEQGANDLAYSLLHAHKVEEKQAHCVADNVVWNELVGRHNFGFQRFPVYLERLAAGGLNPNAAPQLVPRGNTVALLDGDNGFGQYAGALGMEAAIEMAAKSGVGIVGVRNSNFFGTGAFFAEQAAKRAMIGIALSNSFPKVVAHGGLTSVFGTNPFAFGAPRQNGESLLVDIATSSLAGSTVRELINNGQPLPEGLAIDKQGQPITDPAEVQNGSLLPFAGAKGYCIAMLVEILAGVLTGAGVSDGVKSVYADLGTGGNNGHFMMAIDISRFMDMPVYFQRLEALTTTVKQSGTATSEVLLPGEIRWKNYHANKASGIALSASLISQLDTMASDVGISAPWQVPAHTPQRPNDR